MLPEEYHKEACKLLCTWLRRLEERDRKHGNNGKSNTTKKLENIDIGNEHTATNRLPLSDLSTSEFTRTKEKCLR
jgi:hypothetical protein